MQSTYFATKHVIKYLTSVLILCSVANSVSLHQHDDFEGEGKNLVWNATYTDLLKRDLLAHYDKYARPAQHTNVTTVDVDVSLTHIEIDETKFLMTFNGWVKMKWSDEKLVWNKSEYGGLAKLHVADHEVWIPDIVLYNSATGNNVDNYGNVHLLVYPNGDVLWVPPSQFIVYCDLDLTRWPFDRHICSVKLGSWTFGGDMMDLVTNTSKSPENYVNNQSIWKVLSITKTRSIKYYPCCVEPYADIQFDITIERNYSAYYAIIFVPAIGVMLMVLSIFWIPANSGSKFTVAAITALIQSIYLIYYAQRLSTPGFCTPLIVIYYAYGLVLVGISLVVSIISYNIATKQNSTPVPRILANIINSKVTGVLMLPKYKNWPTTERRSEELTDRATLDEDRDDLTSATPHSKRPATAEWFVVASALDRTAFYIYIIIFLTFCIRFIL